MIKRWIIFSLFTYSYCCYGQSAITDTPTNKKNYYATLGIGASTVNYTAQAALNAEIARYLVITAMAATEFNRITINIIGPSAGHFRNANTYNLLLGKVFKQNISFVSVSAGLGLVNYADYTDSLYKTPGIANGYFSNYSTVPTSSSNQYGLNIPILIQAYLVVATPVAFGFNAYVNINTIHPTAGISVNIPLGRFGTRNGKTLTYGKSPRLPLLPSSGKFH